MDKMRQWSLLTALAVVGVLAAGWFLLVSPQRAHAKDLQTQASAQQASTSSLQAQVQQLKEQQKNEPAQQHKLMQIAAQIPDNPQLPALIRELSAAAHKAGVSLDSLAPAQPTPVTATATTGTAAAAPLAQIPVTVQVTGSYFNIESCFRSLEHIDRAMLVSGFAVNPGSGGTSTNTTTGATGGGSGDVGAAPNALTAQISAVVFESPAVAAAQGTAAAPAPVTQSAAPQASTSTPAAPASAAPSAAPAQ